MRCRTIALFCLILSLGSNTLAGNAVSQIPLDGEGWKLATDPQNVGIAEKWSAEARPDAKNVKIPKIIQDDFPGYVGAAWFWRDVELPANPFEDGRYLLRFWDVDYIAEVWVNGTHVGRHEGAQAKFTFDITNAVKPGAVNRIAVRVSSLGAQPFEGLTHGQTPHGAFTPFTFGGVVDSIEVLMTPPVRLDDFFVRADPKSGKVRVEATAINASERKQKASLDFSVAPASSGEPVGVAQLQREFAPGETKVETELQVAQPRLWEPNDPALYRLDGRLTIDGAKIASHNSTRFGFRDFRFENGYFRLNGRRIFLRSAHTGADSPGNIRLPHDPNLLRRDLISLKMSGFNAVRFISTQPMRYQLDMCDEIGLMVYEENYTSWMFADSERMAECMARTITGMLLRDRNHPSIVIWGLLNETPDGSVFRQAVASLPLVRSLDDTRVVLLGSGRFDAIGNFLNGLELWKPESGFAPCVAYNPKDYAICAVALFPAKSVSMIPGVQGEYSVVRWTAPADGEYDVSAKFRAVGTFSVTNLHLLQNGKSLADGFLNVYGNGDRWEKGVKVKLSKGQTLDFVVGGQTPEGGAWYFRYEHLTMLSAAIRSSDGKTFDVSTDFSLAKNPSGTWSYGWLPAGKTPDAAAFRPYAKGETEKYEVIGDICNPGSSQWEDVLADTHYYPRVPHRLLEIERLRTFAGNDKPQFLSEYGIGSGLDLPRFLRQSEQAGIENLPLPNEIRARYAQFSEAWQRFGLDDTFAGHEDYFKQCIAKMAALKRMGLNAVRSNPKFVGYSMTGLNDPVGHGEGFITHFRELKPGATDAMYDGFYPVRWCTFAEPVNVYRGSKVRLEAVLSNEDAIRPGQYPARIEVVGPNNERIFRKSVTVTIPETQVGKELSFVIPVFSEEVPIDGPTGKYRLLATFEKGVAAAGGETEFYATDPADMPAVKGEIAVFGNDPALLEWLRKHNIKANPYKLGKSNARQVILVSNAAGGEEPAEAWRDMAKRVAEGSTAVFLTLDVLQRGEQPLGWLPLANKGTLGLVCEFNFPQLYLKDEWAKKHPLFEGLPRGGLMDYTFYREMIPDHYFWGQDVPAESVAGTIRTSFAAACQAELMLSVYNLGAGRFILNSMRVRQELGQDPTAERLLRNMLRYAKDGDKSVVPLKTGEEEFFKSIGY
jgi:hypothetical protein